MRIRIFTALALASMLLVVSGCPQTPAQDTSTATAKTQPAKPASRLSGEVALDGSSTVFPISEAIAEEFQSANPGVRVTVGISGTGGGFKKFCAGEIAICDASRPIKQSEIEAAAKGGIEFIELPIAFDGLSILVNPQNDWVDKLAVAELKAIWEPSSKITNWKQVRKGFPDVPLKLYGPGTDSGTFEYFTEAIVGEARKCRADFTASEDDNMLVQGIAGDKGALGYFGFAYYEENSDKLKLVPVDNGKGGITPTAETIANGAYSPLSRPLFIYVSTKHAQRTEIDAFVTYFLENAPALVKEVGYIPLPAGAYGIVRDRYNARKTGSAFAGKNTVGLTIEDVLAAEK